MDMKKNSKIPQCGVSPDLTGMKVVVGSKQLRKALQSGRARYVLLAENADPAITQPLEEMCGKMNIHNAWVRSMAERGKSCGIEVGAAAEAVIDP